MHSIYREMNLKTLHYGPNLLTQAILDFLPEIGDLRVGLLNLFLPHTSASLCLSENADPDVQKDLEQWLADAIPRRRHYIHSAEGPDDMPAHIRTVLLGNSLTLPVSRGETKLGTWQGVYVYEHRDNCPSRKLQLTLMGE